MSPVKRTDAHNKDIQFVRFLIMFKHRRPVAEHIWVLQRDAKVEVPNLHACHSRFEGYCLEVACCVPGI